MPPRKPTARPVLLPDLFTRWFAARGWSPREHQLALLAKARDHRSALLIAPTGAGKTLAGFLPTLVELSSAADTSALGAAANAPSPLAGEGRGGGPTSAVAGGTPIPDPSPPSEASLRTGGREQDDSASKRNVVAILMLRSPCP